MKKTAVISQCEKYRYSLTRKWGEPESIKRIMLFVMLNPSTADGFEDDNTLKQCIRFAKKFKCNELEVVNLYAFRTKSPEFMWERSKKGVNIVGPENDRYIVEAAENATKIVCAWGTKNKNIRRANWVVGLLLENHGPEEILHSLGEKTKHGYPGHPLYKKIDTTPLIEF